MSSLNNNSIIFSPITLPNGQLIKNRVAKAAMAEGMANDNFEPSSELVNLYGAWAKGGCGLILTGNIMIDHLAMTGPGGTALENEAQLTNYKKLTQAVHQHDCKIWAQINHPGRQVYKDMGGKVYAPSSIALDLGKHSSMFGQPTAMTETQINEVIERFVTTAKLSEQAGFDGVQIHAAHGYLLAQFLSPLVNKREDQWGGSLTGRARLLLSVVESVKQATSDNFAISVKLNSADFQRGGFNTQDAIDVVKMLEKLNVDLIEVSGGSYEAPAMQGITADGSTLAREAYFLEFAEQIAKSTNLPVMTTGGISRAEVAAKVIESGVAMVGVATALSLTPDLVHKWQQDPSFNSQYQPVKWKNKVLRSMVHMMLVRRNLERIGRGKKAKDNLSPIYTLISEMMLKKRKVKQYLTVTEQGRK